MPDLPSKNGGGHTASDSTPDEHVQGKRELGLGENVSGVTLAKFDIDDDEELIGLPPTGSGFAHTDVIISLDMKVTWKNTGRSAYLSTVTATLNLRVKS
ncbi:hypothetical protein BM1_08034 [Bipolaris maydis]|nr:hypothetical protein BM1_08034 [Bipolaris maydis]